MKVVVAVKAVAALDDEAELVDGDTAVDPDGLEWDLNEWDAFSLEEALTLRDGAGDGEVVALTVGDEEAQDSLLACLAKGADRAVRIWDDALEGADPLAVARVLAAAIEPEAPDLVLCGVQSSDAVNGATGVAVAAHLGLPHVAVVKRLELEAGVATVERELEGGLVEVLRIRLPALMTIQTGINEPRYATLRAIKQARDKPLSELGLDDVGLDAARVGASAGARLRRLRHPEKGEGAEMLDGSPEDVAARIADIVKERMSA
ncbi:MAG TPA: electron transfer flavoprotein subunit beta/FixA family protein [Solirubrobacteraceae bacterium]|nr:electron transfer flavoprotein subunit beta/FixA family protein [Solirubrobacteraceae bacterium]